MDNLLKKQQHGFDKLYAQAYKEYEEDLASIPNPTELDQQEAYYRSDLRYIDGESHEEHMSDIRQRYADMAEHFNRASLVTFYSLLESTLHQLCDLLKSEFGKRIDLSHLPNRNYMESIKNYFDLVLDLRLEPVFSLMDKFTEVQNIRNKIVHHNGMFPLNDNEEFIRRIESNNNLDLIMPAESIYYEVKVRRIQYVLDLYPDLCDLFTKLFWQIEAGMNYPIFKKNILHLFGFVFKEASIEVIEVKPEMSVVCEIETGDAELKKVVCRVTFGKPDRRTPVSITPQFDKDYELLTKLSDYIIEHPELLIDDIFGLFVSKKSKAGISILLYSV